MKIKALFIVLLVAVLALCGCTGEGTVQNESNGAAVQDEVTSDPQQTAVSSADVEDPTENTEEEPASPVLQTEIADGTNENRFECVEHVGDYGYEQNLIWCERRIENVTIIPIESEDADTWYTNGTVVCAFDELLPSAAIKLDMMIPEGFPSHAISYYADGERYVYAIGYNGRDGGISFVEIEVIEKPETEESSVAEVNFNAVIYGIEGTDDEIRLVPEETVIESASAWHVWAALKERNDDYIPRTAYLNSFTVDGTEGTLDLSQGIYGANLGAIFEAKMLEAILSTYIKTYDLEKLYITVDGSVYESGHFVIYEPFTLAE